jgi:Tol biopolymer transport system component
VKRVSAGWTVVFFLMVAGASGLAGQSVELVSRVDPSQISDTGASEQPSSQSFFIIPPSLSADGRYTAFSSKADNLVPGQQDRNGTYDVFLRDAVTGTTLLVSRSLGSQVKTGNALSGYPVISGDGRYVAFLTRANDLAPGQSGFVGNAPEDLLLFDRITGASALVTDSGVPSAISTDGRYLAFLSDD